MARAGDVVTVDFVGASGMKRRPAVVLSTDLYHRERPDVILGVLLTTNVLAANTSFDHVLLDWAAARLHSPSAFRAYFGMAEPKAVRVIGRLSARDWEHVCECVRRALG